MNGQLLSDILDNEFVMKQRGLLTKFQIPLDKRYSV